MVVLRLDELREDAALRLDAERQRRHVEQEDVLHLAAHDAGLDGGADGDDLVRVHALVRLLAEQLGDLLLHGRHAGHAADEHDVLDVGRGEPGVGDHLLRRPDRSLEQLRRQLEQLRARELHVEVLRALGDERQVDLRRHRRGELDLRLLGGVVEPLERDRVLREVGAVVLLELRHEPVDDGLVEVVAAEVVVARRRLHVERPVAELEHGHVERAAAEVEDEDRLVGLLVEAVRERRGRGLVDDAEDVQAGDLAGVLRRLTLGVVEVRGDGDDGVRDLLAEVRLRVGLELLEDHRARSPAARTPCRPPSRARPRSGPS